MRAASPPVRVPSRVVAAAQPTSRVEGCLGGRRLGTTAARQVQPHRDEGEQDDDEQQARSRQR
jgi:hypothetical protein